MGTAADYEFLLRILAVNRIRALYLRTLIAVMRVGGVSSSSLQARLRANRMDRKAWAVNGLQPRPWTRLAKPIRKSTRYFFKKTYSKPWLDDEFLGKTDAEDKAEPEKLRTLSLRGNNYDDPAAAGIRETPPFYVVTVNYHHENQIIRMIKSLRSVNIIKKLIIVDHSGSDSLNSINSDFPIWSFHSQTEDMAAGLNRGLRQIPDQNALVMLCNPDIEILDLDQVIDTLEYMKDNPNVGCVIPKLVTWQRIPECFGPKILHAEFAVMGEKPVDCKKEARVSSRTLSTPKN